MLVKINGSRTKYEERTRKQTTAACFVIQERVKWRYGAADLNSFWTTMEDICLCVRGDKPDITCYHTLFVGFCLFVHNKTNIPHPL